MTDFIASFERLNFQHFWIELVLQGCDIPKGVGVDHF